MARIGYARVSSVGQSLEIQKKKLEDCDKIFEEKMSGTLIARTALKNCLEYVREGDTLVISRLDRLARSILDLCRIAEELERKKVSLVVLDQSINTSDAAGRLMFNMLGVIAQFENELRAERQMEGILKAKQKGVRFGRRAVLNAEEVEQLRQERRDGVTVPTLMRRYRLGKTTVYRYLLNR